MVAVLLVKQVHEYKAQHQQSSKLPQPPLLTLQDLQKLLGKQGLLSIRRTALQPWHQVCLETFIKKNVISRLNDGLPTVWMEATTGSASLDTKLDAAFGILGAALVLSGLVLATAGAAYRRSVVFIDALTDQPLTESLSSQSAVHIADSPAFWSQRMQWPQ